MPYKLPVILPTYLWDPFNSFSETGAWTVGRSQRGFVRASLKLNKRNDGSKYLTGLQEEPEHIDPTIHGWQERICCIHESNRDERNSR